MKNCKTCEWNFDGICASGSEHGPYGNEIKEPERKCSCWSESFEYFSRRRTRWYKKKRIDTCVPDEWTGFK